MAVEIQILSGIRQGDRIELNQTTFLAGDSADAAVSFNPDLDSAVAGRVASFQRADDGWYVRSDGIGHIWVNQEQVSKRTRVRSGDVVRMSERGPDFSFTILSGTVAAAQATATPTPKRVPVESDSQEETSRSVPPSLPTSNISQTVPTDSSPWSNSPTSSVSAVAPSSRSWLIGLIVLAVAAIGIVCVAIMCGAGLFLFRATSSVDPTPPTPTPTPTRITTPIVVKPDTVVDPVPTLPEFHLKPIASQSADVGTAISIPIRLTDSAAWSGKATFRLIDGPRGATLDSETGQFEWTPTRAGDYSIVVTATSNGPDPVEETTRFSITVALGPIDIVAESLYLLEIEDPKSGFVWPFATACAIGPKTLLCTASAATDLARHRKTGRQLKAVHPSSELKTAVTELRIHMAFTRLKDEPEKRIYFDVALIEVEGSLPRISPLASAVEAASLERGMTLTVMGIPHDGESVTRFQTYSPQSLEARLFAITSLDPGTPGGPRLLHVRGEIPPTILGCPLVTEKGKVTALYSVSSPVEKPQDVAIHYAPIVSMNLVAAWLRGEDHDMWIELKDPDNPFPEPSDDKPDR